MIEQYKPAPAQLAKYSNYKNQIQQLCSQVRVFAVFLFPHSQIYKNPLAIPYILTYRDKEITFQQLMQQVTRENSSALNKDYFYHFQLSQGSYIQPYMNVLDLQKQLQNEDLDGISLYISRSEQKPKYSDMQEDNSVINQCAIASLLIKQKQFKQIYDFYISFCFKGNNQHLLTMDISPQCKMQEVKQKFVQQFNKQFVNKIDYDDILDIYIQKTNKKVQIAKDIITQKNLYKGDYLQIVFKRQIKLIKIRQGDHILTIYPFSEKPKKFRWEDIKGMKLFQLVRTYLKQKDYQKIYLRINDLFVAPSQYLSKASAFFGTNLAIRICGNLVYKKDVFYKYLSQVKTQNFDLAKVATKSGNPQQRQNFRRIIQKRLPHIQKKYFKQIQHIQPIFYYTSDLMYENENFYKVINQNLRKQTLEGNQQQIVNDWKYQYTATLVQHLQQIDSQSKEVYRGLNIDIKGKIGQKITFQSFTSTSTNRNVAQTFALQDLFDEKGKKITNVARVLLIIKIKQGKCIKQFSYYKQQQQYLLLPYTQLLIKDIVQKNQKIACTNQTKKLKIYYMEQVQSNRKISKSRANFIIWIDKSIDQGKAIFDLLSDAKHPTALIQLNSTKALVEWIQKYKSIIQDPTAYIIFITNMYRDNNQIAGIQALQIFRSTSQKCKQSPVLFYIGNIEGTKKKLQANNVDMKNVSVCNQPQQVGKFLQIHIGMELILQQKKASAKIVKITSKIKQNPQKVEQKPCDIV